MKTIIEIIAGHNYVATGEQVERLASTVVTGHQADGTYLRVILAHMQGKLGKGRRGARFNAKDAETVLNGIHDELYPHICKGVGNGDIDTAERNRRATFARSAASTVRYFIRGGGDVRLVDVSTATKAGLRKAVQPEQPQAPEGETRVERAFRKAAQTLVRNAQRLLARGDPDTAREQIEQTLELLEGLLAMEPEPVTAQPVQDFSATTTTVGRPRGSRSVSHQPVQLHRSAG